MKFQLTFKSPDAVDIPYLVRQEMHRRGKALHEDNEEEAAQVEYEISSVIDRFVQYGEYVTIEIDTDNNTATVVKN